MNRFYSLKFGSLLFVALVLAIANSRAQDQPQEPTDQGETRPKPAARSLPTMDSGNTQDDNNPPLNPLQSDITPLTGAQNATLGTERIRHSYWVPGIQFASNIRSTNSGPSSSSWYADNYVIGNLSLLQAWSRSQFAVNYSGGGYFSTDSQQGNGVYQQLALTQTVQFERVTLQVMDQFSYLPQSQFGFGGGTNLGVPGAGSGGPTIPGLGGNYIPNQSIYASLGPRYSNSGVVQLTYMLSPRGSITASGSYGLLRFTEPGNVDNNTVTASLGYNYILTHEDTIGLLYRFSSFQYPGQPQAFGDHTFSVAYSRKITGSLALQVYGGPEFTKFRVPIGTQTDKIGGNVSANLTYAFHNGGITGGYLHGMTGGSGVFTGSTADIINFGLNHKLSRVWSGQVNLGYSHNRAVVQSTESSFPTYNSWYVGGGVNRPIGRDFNFAIVYTANIGTTAQPGCTVGSCTSSQTFSYITVNLQWHPRPLILP